MLHQNEAVLPADLVQRITGNVDKSQKQVQNVTLNATVNINGGNGANKASGKKIIDEMFVEIRKRSANQKIMFSSGLIK